MAINPVSPIVDGDTVWVGDWSWPQVVRIPAVGAGEAQTVSLPTENSVIGLASVIRQVDAGAGAIWAASPRLGAVWKIDPSDNAVTRIPMPYPPGGIAAEGDAVWVTVRDN